MEILDVGCGTDPKGDVNVDLFVEPIQRLFVGNIQPDVRVRAKIYPKEIKNFVLADAHYLPFRDESFKIVYSSHLLEHCLRPFKVLKEFHRISRAIVYLEVPYGDRYPDDCPSHFYSWTSKSLEHLLQEIFPSVEVHNIERIAHTIRSGRCGSALLGDLMLVLFRKIRHTILWRKQLTAICHKYPV